MAKLRQEIEVANHILSYFHGSTWVVPYHSGAVANFNPGQVVQEQPSHLAPLSVSFTSECFFAAAVYKATNFPREEYLKNHSSFSYLAVAGAAHAAA